MKKLSLKKLNLETNDMLQRNQLKTVFGGYGGYGGGGCKDKCTSDSQCNPYGNSINPYCNTYYCNGTSGPTFKQCSAT